MSTGNGVSTTKFTPTEQRILKLLSDGQRHYLPEMLDCLWADQGEVGTVRVHLTNLRKKLKLRGQDIVSERWHRKLTYRHVRLLYDTPDEI